MPTYRVLVVFLTHSDENREALEEYVLEMVMEKLGWMLERVIATELDSKGHKQ